jgi:predicted transposase YbfD/YdcC
MPPQGHNLARHFITITDPRMERQKAHSLIDIIMIAICAVIAGCEGWVEIADFGEDKESWLRTFLALPNGIPSHDTFGRVFSLLDPKQFQESFADWMKSVVKLTEGEVIAVDGKTNRHTFGGRGGTRALHLVSAFATANGVALGQVATDQKSNEITAIPELLKLLDITGCLVTTDAMGCQADIAAEILGKGADYLLAVKGNQGLLYRDIKTAFADTSIERDTNASENTGHGRVEKRTCEVMSGLEIIAALRHKNNWVGLRTIVKVTSERTVKAKVGTAAYKQDKPATSTESRYYICSLEKPSSEHMQQAVRAHWKVENSLHWVLDMQMREDDSRIRTDHAPANMAVLRHIGLNIVRSDETRKIGVKASRLKAGRNDAYLKKLLGF